MKNRDSWNRGFICQILIKRHRTHWHARKCSRINTESTHLFMNSPCRTSIWTATPHKQALQYPWCANLKVPFFTQSPSSTKRKKPRWFEECRLKLTWNRKQISPPPTCHISLWFLHSRTLSILTAENAFMIFTTWKYLLKLSLGSLCLVLRLHITSFLRHAVATLFLWGRRLLGIRIRGVLLKWNEYTSHELVVTAPSLCSLSSNYLCFPGIPFKTIFWASLCCFPLFLGPKLTRYWMWNRKKM